MINIKKTVAVDCDTVLDAPSDANVTIEDTNAERVKTVYKLRDSNNIREKILEALVNDTPPEVIDRFILALQNLDNKSKDQVELTAHRSGIVEHLKTTFNVSKFALEVYKEILKYFPT